MFIEKYCLRLCLLVLFVSFLNKQLMMMRKAKNCFPSQASESHADFSFVSAHRSNTIRVHGRNCKNYFESAGAIMFIHQSFHVRSLRSCGKDAFINSDHTYINDCEVIPLQIEFYKTLN